MWIQLFIKWKYLTLWYISDFGRFRTLVHFRSNPADLQVLNIFSQIVVLHLVSCSPLREILVWVLPFLLQPFSLVECLLCSSTGDLDKARSETGMQMSEERQRRSIVTFFELVWETMSISDQSGTYSCCSGCQGSTCCLYGSASFSCGRWGSGTGRAEDCGSTFPQCTLYHCCMGNPEKRMRKTGQIWFLFSTQHSNLESY